MSEFIFQELGNVLFLILLFVPLWWKSRKPISKRKIMAVRRAVDVTDKY